MTILPWPAIELHHHGIDITNSSLFDICFILSALPQQNIGAFVETPLPGMVRMREIYLRFQCFRDPLMKRELLAIICSDGMHCIMIEGQ